MFSPSFSIPIFVVWSRFCSPTRTSIFPAELGWFSIKNACLLLIWKVSIFDERWRTGIPPWKNHMNSNLERIEGEKRIEEPSHTFSLSQNDPPYPFKQSQQKYQIIDGADLMEIMLIISSILRVYHGLNVLFLYCAVVNIYFWKYIIKMDNWR